MAVLYEAANVSTPAVDDTSPLLFGVFILFTFVTPPTIGDNTLDMDWNTALDWSIQF